MSESKKWWEDKEFVTGIFTFAFFTFVVIVAVVAAG